MNFNDYLNEASKHEVNGNGSNSVTGDNIILNTFASVHNGLKRIAISISPNKNGKNGTTWRGDKLEDGENAREWEEEVQAKIVKELKSDFDDLDAKISKLYDKYVGKNREHE